MNISGSEPDSIIDIITNFTEVKVCDQTEMPFGDYSWLVNDTSEVIERKTVSDFVSSFYSGRLANQLQNCLDEYKRVFLLIEGQWKRDADGILVYPSVHGRMEYSFFCWILRCCMEHLDLVYSPNSETSAYTILRLAKGVNSDNFLSKRRQIKKPLPIWTRDMQVIKLLGLVDRLSEKTAKALIKQFGSIGAIGNATPEQLKEVDGVGDGIIHNIRMAIWKGV